MSQRLARRTAARNSCQKKLHDKLLFKSDAPLWDDARFEWKRGDTYWCSSWGSCVCDHRIRERCEIHNTRNGEQAVVGNCCINQFLARLHISEPTRSMIASIRKVQRDPSRALNKYTLHVAQQNRVITEAELNEYLATARRKGEAEKERRRDINARVLAAAERKTADGSKSFLVVPSKGGVPVTPACTLKPVVEKMSVENK